VEIIGVVPASAAKKVKLSSASAQGLEVQITSGPNAGEAYNLAAGSGHPTSLVFGSKPTRASGKRGQDTTSVAIADPKLAPSLAKLTLVVMKSGTRTLEVQNLAVAKSMCGGSSGSSSLRVNGKPVELKVHAFSGDFIQLGSATILSVAAFDGPPLPGKENAVRRSAAAAKSSTAARK
jgi:hypothetical protein